MQIRGSHLIILAAAAFALADLTIIWIGTQTDFAFDFTCCYQQAADRALNAPATLYDWSETYTFRYTPIGALFFAPLVLVDADVAPVVWLAFKLVILAATAAWFARPWEADRRWLVILLVIAFPPIVHDLVIGNVSTLTLLVFLAVARWQDARGGRRARASHRPHAEAAPHSGARVPRRSGGRATSSPRWRRWRSGVLLGLLIFGVDPWIAFIGTLREPLERTFTANIGFSALLGPVRAWSLASSSAWLSWWPARCSAARVAMASASSAGS